MVEEVELKRQIQVQESEITDQRGHAVGFRERHRADLQEAGRAVGAVDIGDHADELALLFQEMARAYRDKPAAIADLTGGRYFRSMKALAAVAYNNQ